MTGTHNGGMSHFIVRFCLIDVFACIAPRVYKLAMLEVQLESLDPGQEPYTIMVCH
jgi:hypothetical protein